MINGAVGKFGAMEIIFLNVLIYREFVKEVVNCLRMVLGSMIGN